MGLGDLHAGEIANCDLFAISVLNNFCAEVAALDRTQVLLVALFVCSILVEHVRRACLNL